MFVTWTAQSGYRSRKTCGPPTESNVNLSHSVAEILQNHVTFQLESIDRMYLNLYMPSLQCEGGVVKFFHGHWGQPFAFSALMSPMTKCFVAATECLPRSTRFPRSRLKRTAQRGGDGRTVPPLRTGDYRLSGKLEEQLLAMSARQMDRRLQAGNGNRSGKFMDAPNRERC